MSVKDSKAKQTSAWFAGGIRFQCRRCGTCCRGEPGYVWVKPAEIAALAAHLGMSRDEFAKRHVRREDHRLSLTERPNGDCSLWDGRCTVYACRPAQCRNFPFWKHSMGSEAQFIAGARGCPGIGSGRVYGFEEVLAIVAGHRDT